MRTYPFFLKKFPGTLRRQQAFSLVEMLTVLAIMGVLAAAFSSSLTTSGRFAQQLDTGVMLLSSALVQARSEAISRNTPVQLRVVTNDPQDATAAGRLFSLWVGGRDANGSLIFDADGKPVYELLVPWERLPAATSVIGFADWMEETALPGPNVFDAGAELGNDLNTVQYMNRSVDVMVVEFSPSGGLRLPRVSGAYSCILMATAIDGAGASDLESRASDVKNNKNWRQISIANLTGQMHVVAP